MLTDCSALGPDPRAVTVAVGLRFHLNEDRIREFLMGENLYAEPSLALRELYQNALDACRLAQARLEFLGSPARPSTADEPGVGFEQGVDAAGREFIDCVDRGAGMNVDELANAFCQAGVRASDLLARQQEAEAFATADPPVVLWQNSRFGIGVMSYFMVAEAMTVTTSRLNPDGSVGDLLRMHITGPADTFDIEALGSATEHGTHVRLWLKPAVSVSAVSTLRDLVLVCPVHLRARDQRGLEHRWATDELNRGSARLPDLDDALPAGGGLWWVPRFGAVLADGLWVSSPLTGMVVNLTGPDMPFLTADRQQLVRLDPGAVDARGEAAAEEGVAAAWHLIGDPEWLDRLVHAYPRIADAIVAAGSRQDLPFTLHEQPYSCSAAGQLVGDQQHAVGESPAAVTRWRFSRMRAAGLYRSIGIDAASDADVEPARPSDAVLLGSIDSVLRNWQEFRTSPWTPTAAALYDAERILGYPLQSVVARARSLGLDLPPDAENLPPNTPTVRTALSFSGRQNPDGRERAISALDVLQTSVERGVSAGTVVSDLAAHRIDVDTRAESLDDSPLPVELLIAASCHANGIAPWREPTDEIGLDTVVAAARATGAAPASIVDGLRELGFTAVPDVILTHPVITDDDLIMLSVDLDGRLPYLSTSRPATRKAVTKAAERLESTEAEVEARLGRFGVAVSDTKWRDPGLPPSKKDTLRLLGFRTKAQRAAVSRAQLRLMSRDDDARAPWLDPRELVPAWLVATKALHGHSIDNIMARYRRLGYDVEDPRTAPVTPRPGPGPGSQPTAAPAPGGTTAATTAAATAAATTAAPTGGTTG